MTKDPGFGVYVHWPFCAAKCPYCDFNSHVRHQGWDEARFLAAYKHELAHMRQLTGPRSVDSIFFGGGTPSLMQAATVAELIEEIARLWSLAGHVEITLEANPSSVEAGRFRGYRQAGVNRVSLGVQALNDADLKMLGRLHNAAEARKALAIAAETFERTSFDLIYARPGQSPAVWHQELLAALNFAPSHLSVYQLTIEEGTPFAALHAQGKLKVPAAEQASELYGVTQEVLEGAGLPAYEISNHARAGAECRHNLVYWRYGSYAGVGPGAHGRLDVGGTRHALSTERHPERWAGLVETNGHGIIDDAALSPAEQADEMLIMGLRLSEGLDLARLRQRTAQTIDEGALAALTSAGMITRAGSRIQATAQGRVVLNRIVLELSGALTAPVRTAPR